MNALETLDDELRLGLDAEERWFRADVCRGIELREGKPSIDREAGIIYGYSVISKGPALGHDMLIDEKTMGQVVALGNKAAMGIKSRFDHPNASNTSMGTFLGRTKNFRQVGDKVLGDLHLSESAKEAPQGDLYTYVLGLADRDPQAFGASIVFDGKAEDQLEPDGTRKKDAKGQPLPRLARVEQLLAADVVDEPAANPGGLFHRSEALASKVTAFLNRWAEQSLFPKLQTALADHMKEDRTMAGESATITVSAADVQQALATGRAEGVKTERERVSGIRKAFQAVWGDKGPVSELNILNGFIELGTSIEDADRMFKERKLTVLTEAAPLSAGGGSETTTTTQKVDLSKLPLDERCKAEWDSQPELRDEFGMLSTYMAFAKAQANGQVKILSK